MISLTYVIVSYNSAAIIDANMYTLLDETSHKVIIVDNNSDDDDLAFLKQRFSQCQILALTQNIGYGRAANAAIEHCDTTHCLLINPDVSISADQVSQLRKEAAKYPEAAILAPATREEHVTMGTDAIEQTFLSGACMLLNRDKINTLGGFDASIFLFSEEADLCTRSIQAGYKLLLLPQIKAQHFEGKSSGESKAMIYMRNWHFAWSRAYYNEKHQLNWGKKSIWRRLFVYTLKSITATSINKRIKYQANMLGTIAFIRGTDAFKVDGRAMAGLNSPTNPYRKIEQ